MTEAIEFAGRVAVIIPTYNERDNICPITARVRSAVPGADLLIVHSRLSFIAQPLPAGLLEQIRTAAGVKVAVPVELFGTTYQKPTERIGGVADACGDLVARNPPQRCDLFGDGAAHSGHGEIDARPEIMAVEYGGMNQKPHRGARARVPIAHVVIDRQ